MISRLSYTGSVSYYFPSFSRNLSWLFPEFCTMLIESRARNFLHDQIPTENFGVQRDPWIHIRGSDRNLSRNFKKRINPGVLES